MTLPSYRFHTPVGSLPSFLRRCIQISHVYTLCSTYSFTTSSSYSKWKVAQRGLFRTAMDCWWRQRFNCFSDETTAHGVFIESCGSRRQEKGISAKSEGERILWLLLRRCNLSNIGGRVYVRVRVSVRVIFSITWCVPDRVTYGWQVAAS